MKVIRVSSILAVTLLIIFQQAKGSEEKPNTPTGMKLSKVTMVPVLITGICGNKVVRLPQYQYVPKNILDKSVEFVCTCAKKSVPYVWDTFKKHPLISLGFVAGTAVAGYVGYRYGQRNSQYTHRPTTLTPP